MTTGAAVAQRTAAGGAGRIAVLVLRLALAAVFAMAGLAKLAGDAAMVEMFADIGAGQWLRIFVGTCEVLGVIGLLVPRLAGVAALGLVALMTGATFTNVVVLEVTPALTIALLVAAAVVAWARWDDVRALVPSRRAQESPWT
ncbi:DoxX family protein [Blastococcus haudaquaticus]|uniref:DoxX-like family protein n=1 Tax=Blastococcus haudaquaticus TaxID=1938745 RepID=A0A286GHJ5_9ACTN|nr:DoxX family protein [Blastococcus haudaquaticus]SOD95007.1 DoxX-like family protein [Blastococcus haudaquaticus]